MGFTLWNDKIVKDEEVIIDKEDRGYQLGDGVYEVVKVYNGEMFTVNEHIDRFYSSAEKIRISIPYTKEQLHQLLKELVEKMNWEQDIFIFKSPGAFLRERTNFLKVM